MRILHFAEQFCRLFSDNWLGLPLTTNVRVLYVRKLSIVVASGFDGFDCCNVTLSGLSFQDSAPLPMKADSSIKNRYIRGVRLPRASGLADVHSLFANCYRVKQVFRQMTKRRVTIKALWFNPLWYYVLAGSDRGLDNGLPRGKGHPICAIS